MDWGVRVRRVAVTAALVVVVAASLQRAASRVFALNFSVSGPGPSIVLVLGLLSAWTLPVARRLGWRRSLRGAVVALPVAVLASAAGDPVLAGVAALAALSLATPWLAAIGARDPAFLPGLGAGVASVAALRGWLGTLPPYASAWGVAALVAVAVVGAVLALDADVPDASASGVAWLAVIAQGAVLAFPAATAAWGGTAYASTALATLAGVVAGVAWSGFGPALDDRTAVVITVAFALAFADLVWVGQLGPAAALLVQATGLRLVAVGLRDDGVARFALAQVVAVAAIVAQVTATNWAYVPGGGALAGHAPLALFALGSAPVLAALLVLAPGRLDDGTGRDPTVLADAARRDALAALAPGALAGLSLAPGALRASGASRSGDGTATASDGPPYDVLTLNVHRWIAGRSAGANYRGVRDLLAAHEPAVVGLQETEAARYTTGSANPVRWLADELDYHHDDGVPTRRGGYGVAVLSTYPILRTSVVSLPVAGSPPRWALAATLDAPDGPLQVVVAHFQTDGPEDDEQEASATAVLGELFADDYERAVVLADCNVEPDGDPAYDRLRRDLVDAWTAAGNPRLDAGGTFPAWDPRQRIDYVWLEGEWSVPRCERVGDPAVSDHLGVLATVDPGSGSS